MISVLFNMRSLITRTFKSNFSSLYEDSTRCRLKCTTLNAVDQQAHLFRCQTILNQLSIEEREHAHSVKYSDTFGPVELQWKVVKVMIRMLEIREDLLEKDGLPVGANTAVDPILLLLPRSIKQRKYIITRRGCMQFAIALYALCDNY